jgi:hypothetical protein
MKPASGKPPVKFKIGNAARTGKPTLYRYSGKVVAELLNSEQAVLARELRACGGTIKDIRDIIPLVARKARKEAAIPLWNLSSTSTALQALKEAHPENPQFRHNNNLILSAVSLHLNGVSLYIIHENIRMAAVAKKRISTLAKAIAYAIEDEETRELTLHRVFNSQVIAKARNMLDRNPEDINYTLFDVSGATPDYYPDPQPGVDTSEIEEPTPLSL